MSGDRLIDEVTAWPGVTVEEGRFGSTRFMLGRRELGHVHGSSILVSPQHPPRLLLRCEAQRTNLGLLAPPMRD
jgi:hypothetical protein